MKTRLTPEKLRDIYTDPEFRNQVAHAHGVFARISDSEPVERITCSYPVVYVVTPEQIAEAGAELARAKKAAIEATRGKLVLIGMGSVIKGASDPLNNYRVRGYFLNRNGQRCFVEFIQGKDRPGAFEPNTMLYPDHAMIEEVPVAAERKNFGLYTAQNALRFVNEVFGCDFKEIAIDNFTLEPSEVLSEAEACK